MNNSTQSRAPHAHRSLIAAKVGFVLRVTVFVCSATTAVRAQSSCSLTAIKSSGTIAYPKIAMSAHIAGDIQLRAEFAPNGAATSIMVVEGPALSVMRAAAVDYLNSWKVNESMAGQDCNITLSFRLEDQPSCGFSPSTVTMTNLQHFTVAAKPAAICEDLSIFRRRHRFLFFHWTTSLKISDLAILSRV